MQTILGLVGQIASGKGSVSDYLRKKYKAKFYHFSTPLRQILRTLKQEETRENIAKLSQVLRRNFGQDLLAKIITADIQNDRNKIIVVDSVRRMQDIKYLKDLPEFKLVYIKVGIKTRYQRLIERNENKDDKTKTYKQFIIDNKRTAEREITSIGKKAKYAINNEESLEELHKQIDKIILKELKKI